MSGFSDLFNRIDIALDRQLDVVSECDEAILDELEQVLCYQDDTDIYYTLGRVYGALTPEELTSVGGVPEDDNGAKIDALLEYLATRV